MMNGRILAKAVTRAALRPTRTARAVFSGEAWTGLAYYLRDSQLGATTGEPLTSRRYKSYDAYLKHQKSKLALLDLSEYDQSFRTALAERLAAGGWAGRSVLCLAARIGTEVKAFHDVGAFAVGIDLNPGKSNPWVLPGDFHHLVFANSSTDAVYCNALDHALDLDRTVNEVRRVLKRGGRLLVDAQQGAAQAAFDAWAATSWNFIDDLVKAIESHDFTLVHREAITSPWPGEHLVFETP